MLLRKNAQLYVGLKRSVSSLLQDDKGNWSSGRFVFLVGAGTIVWMIKLWTKAYNIEILKDKPDYEGLVLLFRELVIMFGVAYLFKVLSKVAEIFGPTKNIDKDANIKPDSEGHSGINEQTL